MSIENENILIDDYDNSLRFTIITTEVIFIVNCYYYYNYH